MSSEYLGLRLAGAVWHRQRHACAFFNDKDEEFRVLLPFIKEGVEAGQNIVHVTEANHRQEYLRRLQQASIDTEQAERSGQLEVLSWEDAYLRGGCFDQHAMLVLVEQVLTSSKEQGYALTRLTANMDWALQDLPGVDDLVEYEATVNHVLSRFNDAVI
jgi:hypothetical protein